MHKFFLLVVIVLGVIGAGYVWRGRHIQDVAPTPSTSTSPLSQQYKDLVVLTSPLAGASITSPVTITGRARGTWFFEASFPVNIVDWDGLIIGQGIAQAQGDWMTSEYVPFTATITFTKPTVKNNGWMILKKDNPSGLPEHDDAFEVPVLFK
jgi:hypothetical protein